MELPIEGQGAMKRLLIVGAVGHGRSVAAIVWAEAQLGAGVIVNCAAVVDHHCQVEDFGHLRNSNAIQ